MRFVGMMCVKNEASWIDAVLRSQDFCEKILVMDDHSTDDTVDICKQFHNVDVFTSPFPDYHEGRNNTFLAAKIEQYNPDWVCHLMGDEILERNTWQKIQSVNIPEDCNVLRVHAINIWAEEMCRIDARWAKRMPPTFWKFPRDTKLTYYAMHCALPEQIESFQKPHPDEPALVNLALYHMGYSTPALRQQAFDFYWERDPTNPNQKVISDQISRVHEYCHLLDENPTLTDVTSYAANRGYSLPMTDKISTYINKIKENI